jgi:hypothetical protein
MFRPHSKPSISILDLQSICPCELNNAWEGNLNTRSIPNQTTGSNKNAIDLLLLQKDIYLVPKEKNSWIINNKALTS